MAHRSNFVRVTMMRQSGSIGAEQCVISEPFSTIFVSHWPKLHLIVFFSDNIQHILLCFIFYFCARTHLSFSIFPDSTLQRSPTVSYPSMSISAE